MQRRALLAALPALGSLPALAHHGWSSFDQDRPIYLSGKAVKVAWRNPHAELQLELPENPSQGLSRGYGKGVDEERVLSDDMDSAAL